MIGANGNVSFLSPGLDGTVETSDPYYSGNNTITVGQRRQPHPGRHRLQHHTAGDGNNVIFGADAVLTFVDTTIEGDSTLLAFSGQTTVRA